MKENVRGEVSLLCGTKVKAVTPIPLHHRLLSLSLCIISDHSNRGKVTILRVLLLGCFGSLNQVTKVCGPCFYFFERQLNSCSSASELKSCLLFSGSHSFIPKVHSIIFQGVSLWSLLLCDGLIRLQQWLASDLNVCLASSFHMVMIKRGVGGGIDLCTHLTLKPNSVSGINISWLNKLAESVRGLQRDVWIVPR